MCLFIHKQLGDLQIRVALHRNEYLGIFTEKNEMHVQEKSHNSECIHNL